MKVVGFVIFILILLQGFTEGLSVGKVATSLSNVHAKYEAVHKKYHFQKLDCNYACARRCSRTSRKNVCNRACRSCCNRCHCVPTGTYGNRNSCPCYARLRTHGNRLKCP